MFASSRRATMLASVRGMAAVGVDGAGGAAFKLSAKWAESALSSLSFEQATSAVRLIAAMSEVIRIDRVSSLASENLVAGQVLYEQKDVNSPVPLANCGPGEFTSFSSYRTCPATRF